MVLKNLGEKSMKQFITILTILFSFNLSLMCMEEHQFSHILSEETSDNNNSGYDPQQLDAIADYSKNTTELTDEELKDRVYHEVETLQDPQITPLIWAIMNNYSDKAYLFINSTDIDRQTASGDTALIIACSHGNIELVKMLLKAGANPNIQNLKGHTSLMIAIEKSNVEIVSLLLTYDSDTLLTNADGYSALDIANKQMEEHQFSHVFLNEETYDSDNFLTNAGVYDAFDIANKKQEQTILNLLHQKLKGSCEDSEELESDITIQDEEQTQDHTPLLLIHRNETQTGLKRKADTNKTTPNKKQKITQLNAANSYDCVTCSKTFKSKDNLNQHKTAHTDERPFACNREGCGKTFKDSNTLNVVHINSYCMKDLFLVIMKDVVRLSKTQMTLKAAHVNSY